MTKLLVPVDGKHVIEIHSHKNDNINQDTYIRTLYIRIKNIIVFRYMNVSRSLDLA